MVSRRTIGMALIVLIYIIFQWGVPVAQKTYRRYMAPKEYNQRVTQEHYDDMSKRLDRLERGQR